MRSDVDRLEARTAAFASSAVRLQRTVTTKSELVDICRQMSRSALSVSANQRAVRRARSWKEFSAKLQIVCEEIDEAAHWLMLLKELEPDLSMTITPLHREACELRAIYAKARKTTRIKMDGSAK